MAIMQTFSTQESPWAAAQRLFQAGSFSAARAAAERVISGEPLHSGARLMLANLASNEGRHREAVAHALAAAERMGRQTLQHVAEVALKLISVGEYEASVRLIGKINPAAVPAASSLAEFSQQLSLMDQHEDALRYMQSALSLGLDGDWVHYIHGNYLKFMGRLDAAADAYERSLRSNPDFAFSHLAIAYLGRPGGEVARASRIRESIARVGPFFRDLAYLHYALFKELDGLDETDAAWQALQDGFIEKKRGVSHDAAAETALVDSIIARTGEGFVGEARPANGARTPIFVLGMPRTGTTLLERILGGHSEIALCGELNDFRMQYKWASDHFCLGFFDPEAVQRIDRVDYAQTGQRYLDHVAWRVPGRSWFTDKNPGNLMMAGLILRALPHARIIHLRRNPMDSCFSNLKELFGSNAHPYSYDFADLATHYRNYTRLMAHWHEIAPGRILDLDYEDMVSDPDTSARRVMAYCGLAYQPAQIRVEANAAPVSTASSTQVRQPIHKRNIGGWKRYARQLEPLRLMLEPLAP